MDAQAREAERKEILRWGETHNLPLNIELITTEDERSSHFIAFCDLLKEAAPFIRVKQTKDNVEKHPRIRINPNLSFMALPVGKELSPFLTALSIAQGDPPALSDEEKDLLDGLDMRAEFKVFVAEACPFCPKTVTTLLPAAFFSPHLGITVIDGTLFSELAALDKVQAAPTVILDGRFRWTGQVRLAELLKIAKDRNPDDISGETLFGMLREKETDSIHEIMIRAKKVVPGFFELLTHPFFSVRLGAMAVFEGLCETHPEITITAVSPLFACYNAPGHDVSVKGDMLYLVGLCGDKNAIPSLEKVVQESGNPDIKEAAQEAIEDIQNRF